MLSSSLDIYIHIQYSDIHIYIYIYCIYTYMWVLILIYLHIFSHLHRNRWNDSKDYPLHSQIHVAHSSLPGFPFPGLLWLDNPEILSEKVGPEPKNPFGMLIFRKGFGGVLTRDRKSQHNSKHQPCFQGQGICRSGANCGYCHMSHGWRVGWIRETCPKKCQAIEKTRDSWMRTKVRLVGHYPVL